MSDYGSGDQLDYPSSPNSGGKDEEDEGSISSQTGSQSSDIDPFNDEYPNYMAAKGWSIMDEQEVEEESETDPTIKGARAVAGKVVCN